MNVMRTKNQIMVMMQPVLTNSQMMRLSSILECCLFDEGEFGDELNRPTNFQLLDRFLTAKRIEGCSERSIKYYKTTLIKFLEFDEKSACDANTDDVRRYLVAIKSKGTVSHVTIDNVRRVISSFFTWLEDEDYIIKSPVRKIKKIKAVQTVKEVYTDEEIEKLRDNCGNIRDLAIIDILRSTGMRVGELVGLDRSSLDLVNQECRVLGKGGKERIVYFDSRTKLHLEVYLSTRCDTNKALFVSHAAPYKRLQIGGVESLLRKLGRKLNIGRVHPHKFRRTLATKAIDKGMPIEQVQLLLGHKKIDTTMHYAMVDQLNVKASHKRFIS